MHDKKIKKELRKYRSKAKKIYGDIPGYPKPPKIGRHRPDGVIEFKNGRIKILEIETEDTLNSAHAKSQRKSFQGYANLKRSVSFKTLLAEK